jgi:Mn-containing catalase
MSSLKELLVEQMQDLLHAEGQLVKALPKMAKAARDPQLKDAFQKHLEETEGHVERLREAFDLLGAKAKAKVCKGMAGLVEEGQETITEHKQEDDVSSDLALIAAAQRVEHYEMAGYGTIRTLADQIGDKRAAKLFAQTLAEEEKADQLLTKVAEPLMTRVEGDEGEEQEEDEEAVAVTAKRGRR